MKFEIDDKTGLVIDETNNIISSLQVTKFLIALQNTHEELGRDPNYTDKRQNFEVIIYDGKKGFVIQDITGFAKINYDPKIRRPSPEEVEKFIKHADLAALNKNN